MRCAQNKLDRSQISKQMKNIYSLLLALFLTIITLNSFSQRVWIEPQIASTDDEITIYLDINGTNFWDQGELGVFMHAGVILEDPNNEEWGAVNGEWDDIDDGNSRQMQKEGNLWVKTITPRTYFNLAEDAQAYRLEFVFRNQYDTNQPNNVLNNNGENFKIDLLVPGESMVELNPPYPTTDEEVTITFRATKAQNPQLIDAEQVYLHSAAVISGIDAFQWDVTTGNWGQEDGLGQMIEVQENVWEITITPEEYYQGIDFTKDNIFKLAMVFRNGDGSSQQKGNDGNDIFWPIDPGFYLEVNSPDNNPFLVEQSVDFDIIANTPETANYTLEIDGVEVYNENNTTNIDFQYSFGDISTRELSISATDGETIKTKTYQISSYSGVDIAEVPEGLKYGPNYNDNDLTEVTLVLPTPTTNKEVIHVIGSFNNWQISETYKMKKTPDGTKWWLTITDLEPRREYRYQYLIDGAVRVGDPYADKVSDPDDIHIEEYRYPDLISYPSMSTTRRATVFQTGQFDFLWEGSVGFKRPASNKLNIYELHIRDFTEEGTYNAALEKLDYIENLGVNCIHIMPVNEFEGNSSWGYNPNFYFAPDKYYGTKNDLKAFIDECHARDIAVVNDLVLNHSFYSSPLAQMYWNKEDNRPADDNPWYNAFHNFANPAAQWGADLNHESLHTQALIDSVINYWITEYKFDGIRFDFTKGFSNTAWPLQGDTWGSGPDWRRAELLERMVDVMWSKNPGTYAIFEHLASPEEERRLANHGVLMWGGNGITQLYEEIALGHNNQNLSRVVHNDPSNDFAFANLISYMESHDEERVAYKIQQHAKDVIKDNPQRWYSRLKLNAAFNLIVPGPKMIWQFGELGYDFSINENGRTGEKPVRWDYYEDPDRRGLYDFYSFLLKLRNTHEVFHYLVAYRLDENAWVKWLYFSFNGIDVIVIGNFNPDQVFSINITDILPFEGDWNELVTQQRYNFNNLSQDIYGPDEVKIYSNVDILNQKSYEIENHSWLVNWDDVNLNFTITNANPNEAAVIYIDHNPIVPVNGGDATNGLLDGFNYDGLVLNPSMRADYVIYAKNDYQEQRIIQLNGTWSDPDIQQIEFSALTGENIRKITIPWQKITGGAKPNSFNWTGCIVYNNGGNKGVYASVPVGNPLGEMPDNEVNFVRYFEVNTETDNPFEKNCYASLNDNSNDFGDIEVYSLTINNGNIEVLENVNWDIDGTLTLVGNGSLDLNNSIISIGNGINCPDNTFTVNTQNSTIHLDGKDATSITGEIDFNNLIINTPSTVQLYSPIDVSNELSLVSGRVESTIDNIITIQNGATINSTIGTGSFIDGPLRKIGNTSFLFPVGNGVKYAPVTLEDFENVQVDDSFTTEYIFEGYENTRDILVIEDVFEEVSDKEHWLIDKEGNGSTRIRLHWDNGTQSGIADPEQIVVAHFNEAESHWESMGGTHSGTFAKGSILSDRINNFSPFSYGGTSEQLLPVKFIYFKGKYESDKVILEWKTGEEVNNSHFEIFKSFDGVDFTSIDQVKGTNNYSGSSYSFFDHNNSFGKIYYKLKQVDFDLKYMWSKIIEINAENYQKKSQLFSIYPNPVKGNEFVINKSSSSNFGSTPILNIKDITGKTIEIVPIADETTSRIELKTNIMPGLYFIQIMPQNETQKILFE